MLERNGVRIAAVSYDSEATLRRFAEKYNVGFPLLADVGSAVIRSFGIFNTNIAPGLRAYGVPHPVNYLVAPDGIVIRKYFVPNYQHRVTASAVALREFGLAAGSGPAVTISSGPLTAAIELSGASAFAGQELAFTATFKLEPGWHVYGSLSVTFDDPRVASQSFELPAATPLEIKALEETIPVYSDSFQGTGTLLLKWPMEAGRLELSGQLRFQACSDTVCEAPDTVAFKLPLTIEPFLVPAS
jgi:AhpC/TSA family/Disulphide bond corrector protein DsbC